MKFKCRTNREIDFNIYSLFCKKRFPFFITNSRLTLVRIKIIRMNSINWEKSSIWENITSHWLLLQLYKNALSVFMMILKRFYWFLSNSSIFRTNIWFFNIFRSLLKYITIWISYFSRWMYETNNWYVIYFMQYLQYLMPFKQLYYVGVLIINENAIVRNVVFVTHSVLQLGTNKRVSSRNSQAENSLFQWNCSDLRLLRITSIHESRNLIFYHAINYKSCKSHSEKIYNNCNLCLLFS